MPESPRPRRRNLAKPTRSWTLAEMEYNVVRPKPQALFRILVAVSITVIFLVILRRSPSISYSDPLFKQESGSLHVLVTGGAGYIGSHAALRLLEDGHRVTIVDNLSRGNLGAVEVLKQLFPESGRLHFVLADLGDSKAINAVFVKNKFDVVLHFAAVAYVGESVAEPLRYYHNITTNTLLLLEAMDAHDVSKLIYSSTCATYGEPAIMPITEKTLQVPINPYGKAKKMSEDIIKDYARNGKLAATILRYFNVIGSDPEGRLGEAPRPELRQHGRITGACFDAAMGLIGGLTIKGQDYETKDGTCIRDYIHVTDLVDAHVKAMATVSTREVQVYNVGTGKGSSVREFVEACKKATGVNVTVFYEARRPGDYAEVYSNPSKIREELHWAAEYTDLAESLSMAWKWRKQNPNGYKDPKALMLQYALPEILNPKLDGMTVVGEANLVKSA